MKYIIIGNGVAGVEAALAIRNNDMGGEIIIVSEENNLLYYRPRLIDYISGSVTFEKILSYKESIYEEKNIKNILGTRIVDIDKYKKEIKDEKGKVYKYDKLLLALGANPFIPPTNGNEKEGVFSLRTKEDAGKINSYCKGLKNVLVIGGGLLGIETANSLLKIVESVTVVEYFDRLLPRQLDAEGSKILQDKLSDKGINFILGDTVKEIQGEDKVNKVILNSGKEINVDAVIYSIGIRCRLDLAKQADINVNKGILVTENMETSADDIYAAGDVIELKGSLFGQWMPAKQQGNIAGINMSGTKTEYKIAPIETRLKITDISLFSVGSFDSKEGDVKVSKEDGIYRKLVIKDGNIIGAIIMGDKKEELLISKILNGKASLEQVDMNKYI
jgi:nitrite reductase (NADH) large subunit